MKGFTLIELLLVVALILIIGVSSAVFYSRFYLQNSVTAAVDKAIATLRKAQIYSMSGRFGDSWSVNYSANTLTLYKGANFAGRDQKYDERYSFGQNIIISGLTDIKFTRISGIPNTTAVISITGGGNSKQITINNQGVVNR